MMNPKKKYSIILFLIVLINFTTIHIVLIRADDYDLSIDENTVIEWEVTTANEDELEKFFSYSTDYDYSDFDYEEGDEIKMEISSITDYDDYYEIECAYYENSVNQGNLYEQVAIDPADLAEDIVEDYGDTYSVFFICTDTKDYLAEFNENIPTIYNYFIYASGSSMFINLSLTSYPYCIIVKYDEDGIQEKLTLLRDNLVIFEMELQDVTHSDPFSTFLTIFLIVNIIIIIAIVVIVVTVVLIKRRSKKRAPSAPQPMPYQQSIPIIEKQVEKTEIPKETIDIGDIEVKYCEHCGTLKDKNDKYCPICGIKY